MRYAFIAGSRAGVNARPDSDVDFVVVLNYPSRHHEIGVAEAMRDLHIAYGLEYSHCGEVISQPTLENMLLAGPNLRRLIDIGFLDCACFGADCILSIARKFLVVLGMLAGPKSNPVGDLYALQADALRASQFFDSVPRFRIPKPPRVLDWESCRSDSPRLDSWQRFMAMIQANNFDDTPVGIGLERWFMHPTIHAPAISSSEDQTAPLAAFAPEKCPLEQMPTQHQLRSAIEVQCLSIDTANLVSERIL
jgi:hypothetical protein